MKQLLLSLLCAATVLFAFADMTVSQHDETRNLSATYLDTLSYVLGHQYTLGLMAGKNELMETETDFKDYLRGLEDFLSDNSAERDSAYIFSYSLGGIQGVFMTDGRSEEDLRQSLPCIVKGLRRVADGSIVLPDDTIKAREVLKRTAKGKEDCEFFTAIGIFKAYPIGLQEYLEEMAPGKGLTADVQAYREGMIDVLKIGAIGEPKTAYDLGKLVASVLQLPSAGLNNFQNLHKASILSGAKAALRLGDDLIPREQVENFLENIESYPHYVEDDGLSDEQLQNLLDFKEALNIQHDTKYSVNWHVKASPVAEEGCSETGKFEAFLRAHLPDADGIPGILMATVSADSILLNKVSSTIKEIPLSRGFKWFCYRNNSSEVKVGIVRTNSEFEALVDQAWIDFSPQTHTFQLVWRLDPGVAAVWSQFTEDNIGKTIALQINGETVMAPKVNIAITSGDCTAIDLTPETVNLLFKNAVPIAEESPTILIETIE